MKRIILGFVFSLLTVATLAQVSFADERSYVWTYEYQTMYKGESEAEAYETIKIPKKSDSGIKTLEHWIEYELSLIHI